MKITVPVILLLLPLLCLAGCADPAPQEKVIKYPRKPADNPERKSGLPMLFYEAAEEDADINDVIVTPPKKTDKKQSAP